MVSTLHRDPRPAEYNLNKFKQESQDVYFGDWVILESVEK